MKLKEAIKTIKSIIYDNKGNSMDYIDISFSQSKEDIGAEEFIQAIETVLQALEDSVSKDIIRQKINERQFELQQEYKDFKDDIKLNTLQEIYYYEEG